MAGAKAPLTLAVRAHDAAVGIPKADVSALLESLLTPRPASTRAPITSAELMQRAAMAAQDALAKGAPRFDPFTPPKVRYRSPRNGARDYEVKRPDARGRPGTWTAYMIRVALRHTNTRVAEAWQVQDGGYAGKKIDWTWLEKEGYIAWK